MDHQNSGAQLPWGQADPDNCGGTEAWIQRLFWTSRTFYEVSELEKMTNKTCTWCTVGPWFSDMISRRNLWILTSGCWWINIIPGCQKKTQKLGEVSEKWLKLCSSCWDLTIVTDLISPHFRWNVSRWKWIYIHMSIHNNILVVVYATSQITSWMNANRPYQKQDMPKYTRRLLGFWSTWDMIWLFSW